MDAGEGGGMGGKERDYERKRRKKKHHGGRKRRGGRGGMKEPEKRKRRLEIGEQTEKKKNTKTCRVLPSAKQNPSSDARLHPHVDILRRAGSAATALPACV